MNPSYLNSSPSSFPFIDLNEDQHLEHLISLPHHATPNYFNLNQEYRSGSQPRESLQNQKKVEKNIVLFGGSSDRRAISSSSSSSSLEPTAGDMVCKREDHHEDEGKSTTITTDDGSMKWMSSKMRVMRKMTNSDKPAACSRVAHKFNDQINSTNYNSNDFVRVCSDCNTTKTPLWRGGPQGPKSLCNACGIRQRKARRAMAEAANGRTELNYTETSTSTKKLRTSYIAQKKQHFKLIGTNSAHTSHDQKKLSFEDFALSLTSKKNLTFRDEEEAAILLMALSCGLIHS